MNEFKVKRLRLIKELKKGRTPNEILEKIPDNRKEWVKSNISLMQDMVKVLGRNIYIKYYTDVDTEPYIPKSRKEISEIINKQHKNLQPFYYMIYSEKNYDELLWKHFHREQKK